MAKTIFTFFLMSLIISNASGAPTQRFTLPEALATAFRDCFREHYDYLTPNSVLRPDSSSCAEYDYCSTALQRDHGISDSLLTKLAFALAFQQGKATRTTVDPRRYGDEYGRESSTIELNECVDLEALKREVVTNVLRLEASVTASLEPADEDDDAPVVVTRGLRAQTRPNATRNCP